MKIFATLVAALCVALAQETDNNVEVNNNIDVDSYVDVASAVEAIDASANQTNHELDAGILVVGGREAPRGRYPWTVNLRRSPGGSSFCGGSLIAPQFVLTAAHCVSGSTPAFVVVGTHFNNGNVDGEAIQVFSTIVHPNYINPQLGNDVALLRLMRTSRIAPIPLSKDFANAGLRVKLLGWGQTSGPSGNPSTVLKENDFFVVSNSECQARLRSSPNFAGWWAQPSHLCAGGVVGQASCFGDSGGPLVRSYGNGFALVGDVSYGVPCGRGFPDVYGRVTDFRSFIDRNSRGHVWV